MAVTGFCHAAIGVTDPEKSIAFYRDILGLTVTKDMEERGKNSTFHRRAIYLRWDKDSDAGFIVLDHHLNRAPKGQVSQMFDVGVHHIGLTVDDAESIFNRAKQAGVEVFADLVSYNAAAFGLDGDDDKPVVITGIIKDPDGNIIQLDQWL